MPADLVQDKILTKIPAEILPIKLKIITFGLLFLV